VAALLAPAAAGAVVAVDEVAAVVGATTAGGVAVPAVKPELPAGGAATGAIGVVDNSAAGLVGRITAVVPAPVAALGALGVVVGGALGACAPPVALMLNVALGAPGHGGHALDSGVGDAGRTPAVLVEAPAAGAAPVATGTPRIAPVPLVCARATALHDESMASSKHPRSVTRVGGAHDVPFPMCLLVLARSCALALRRNAAGSHASIRRRAVASDAPALVGANTASDALECVDLAIRCGSPILVGWW
jgi:hypothetical protein